MAIKASSPEQIRLFFALWPEVEVRQALHMLGKRYRERCDGRAMREDTLHMTLLFLGMVDRERLAQLMNVADSIAARSFSVSLQRFSCWRHNRIGYVAPIAEVEALDALVMALRHAVAQAGFDFDHKAFKPHVTLLRNVRHMIESCDVPETIWRVDQFALVASVTTDQRARYEVIRSWALSGAVVSG